MIYTRMGTPITVLSLAMAGSETSPAVLICRRDDGTSRQFPLHCLIADGGVKEIEAACIASCGKDLCGRVVNGDSNETVQF